MSTCRWRATPIDRLLRWPAMLVLPAVLAIALCVGPFSPLRAQAAADEPPPVEADAELEAKIAQLIAQLGAEEFAQREKAQRELERIGVAAFDALHAAQSHGAAGGYRG